MSTTFVIRPIHKAELVQRIFEKPHPFTCYKKATIEHCDSDSFCHFGLFRIHSLGSFIGFVTIDSNTKEVVALYSINDNNNQISRLLEHHAKKSPFSTTYTKLSTQFPMMISPSITKTLSSSSHPEVVITADMKYIPFLAHSHREREPHLFAFLSTNVCHEDPILVRKPEQQTELRLRFRLTSQSITDHTLLNFEQYSLYLNDNDKWCLTPAGSASVQLSQFIIHNSPKATTTISIHYQNSPRKTLKAQLTLSNIRFSISPSVSVCIVRDAKESTRVHDEAFMNACKASNEYIKRNIAFYESRPVTIDALRSVTVFCDKRKNNAFFPGSMFDIFRAPRTSPEFYLKLLELSIQRKRMSSSKQDMLGADFCKHPDPSFRLYVVMNMLVMFTHPCEYITDLLDHNCERFASKKTRSASASCSTSYSSTWDKSKYEEIDSFDPIEHRFCADCEDFAAFILRLVNDLLIHVGMNASPIFSEIVAILHRYTFASVLCGVSSAAISSEPSQLHSQELKSHECVFAIPTDDILTAVRNYNPHSCMLTLLASRKHTKLPCDHIIPLEGTGILFVEPNAISADEAEFDKMLRRQFPLLSTSKNMHSYNPDGDHNFFKIMSTAIIPSLFIEFGMPEIEYIFAYKREGQSLPSRGVFFSDMMNVSNHPEVCLVPCPSLTPETIAAYSFIKKDDFPRVVLHPMTPTASHSRVKSTLSNAVSIPSPDVRSSPVARFYFHFDDLDLQAATLLKQQLQESGYSFLTRVEGISERPYDESHHGAYEVLIFKV